MTELQDVFKALREVMKPYAAGLGHKTDSDKELYLEAKPPGESKPVFFGAVQLKKNYVSYHLMPVYTDPDLLGAVSPELKKRMQGKSCFNFYTVDPALYAELAVLTEAALGRFRQNGHV